MGTAAQAGRVFGPRRTDRTRTDRRVYTEGQDQRRDSSDGDRHRRDLGCTDLRDGEGRRAAAGVARIQRRARDRRRTYQGGTTDARSRRDRQASRAFGAGAGGAARTDEDQSARHELSGSAGKLGSARRQADAARLSLALVRNNARGQAAIEATARSSTSAIASRKTLTPGPGLTPFSAR